MEQNQLLVVVAGANPAKGKSRLLDDYHPYPILPASHPSSSYTRKCCFTQVIRVKRRPKSTTSGPSGPSMSLVSQQPAVYWPGGMDGVWAKD
ncbi:unnamed protein product [Sphagnum troendelagicum]|jgi:hypothetical protein